MSRLFVKLGLVCLAVTLSGCSLFKFTVSTADKPLSQQELNTRVMVRGFYSEFVRSVISAADTIAVRTPNVAYKMNALRWKMNSTSACADAAFGGVPEITMINTWVLCKRMDAYFNSAPDSLLFGQQTAIARKTATKLLATVSSLARQTLTQAEYRKMETFVDGYATRNPMKELSFTRFNLMLDWIESDTSRNRSLVGGVGSIPEVMSDMNDRITGLSNQWGNELSWSKEMITMQMQQDSLSAKLTARIDSISLGFNRMVVLFEDSPQMLQAITADINTQMMSLIGAINGSVNAAFHNFAQERAEFERFFDSQRMVLVDNINVTVETAVKTTMSQLPALIGKTLIYIVVALLLLLSIPFFAGYLLGKWRTNQKNRPKNEDKNIE